MYDLGRLRLADMTNASSQLRKLGAGASSMEEASQRVAQWMFDSFGDAATGISGCALVRVYKTHLLGGLPEELQAFARRAARNDALAPTVRCLVLLGTTGVEPTWCSRSASQGHKAIPLPSAEAVEQLPMVAQLVSQLGIDVAHLLTPGPPLLVDPDERRYNVFHVEKAPGSPHIPAQDFVLSYGVRSVLGCGGQLPDGELFAAILFARDTISRETADAFKPLTLALKLALLPFKADRTFQDGP
jgi:two-component system NtrC family sensor kinase